MWYTRA